jgi:hypothetical protein
MMKSLCTLLFAMTLWLCAGTLHAQDMGSTHGPLALVPVAPAGGLTLYASPTGNDTSNNCSASGTPCTLKGACNIRSQFAMFLGNTVNINLANGTYSTPDGNNALCSQNGNQGNGPILTSLLGNCGSPGNVILAVPANDLGILVQDLAEVSISCLTITGGNGSVGISAGQFSVADINTVHFGAFGTSSVHLSATDQASINILGSGEFIDGGASFHWQLRSNAVLNASGGTTITTNVAFSGSFLDTRGAVYVDLSSWTLTNSSTVTGGRANLVGPGYMLTVGAGACSAIIPGGSGCALTLGFQDNAGDLQTAAFPLQANSIANAKLAPGSANTVKGSLNGTSETDLAVNTCTGALTYAAGVGFGCSTLAGTGTVTEQKNTASGGAVTSGNCDNTTSNAGSPCNVAAPGGFLNLLRNNSLTAWFHGCVGSACTITTAGGWCAEGVWVVPTAASVTCAAATTTTFGTPYYSLNIIGNTSVTDVKVRFVVESFTHAKFDNKNVTFQVGIFNNTGGTITPALATNLAAGGQDNWSTTTPDLAATNLQACTNSTTCTEAYTLAVSGAGDNGYEFVLDLGNNFSTTGKNVRIVWFDARLDAAASTGLNSNPPPFEMRDPASDFVWNQRFYETSYDNSVAPGAATPIGMIGVSGTGTPNGGGAVTFRTAKRCDPTMASWDSAGTSNKTSVWNGSAWVPGQTGAAFLNPGQNGSPVFVSTTVTINFHYTADCTISGG